MTGARLDFFENELDLAVREGAFDDSSLVARSLGRSSVYLCASPDYVAQRAGVGPARPHPYPYHDCRDRDPRRVPESPPPTAPLQHRARRAVRSLCGVTTLAFPSFAPSDPSRFASTGLNFVKPDGKGAAMRDVLTGIPAPRP